MTLYYWRGVSEAGIAVRGQLRATSRNGAREQLRLRRVTTPRLVPLPEQLFSISSTQITLFIRQLATLLSSGLTLSRALEGIIQGLSDSQPRRLAEDMALELQQGAPFSEIVAARPQYFDPFLIHLVQSGEHAGQLPLLLARGAEHRERSRALKRQAWKALSYPLGVFLFTLTISLFLLLQVVPQFEVLFHNLGGELPLLTRRILGSAHFLQDNLATVMLSITLSLLLPLLLYRISTPFRTGVDRLLLSFPIVGTTLREVMVARLSRTLATLQETAIPIHMGLTTSARMTNNLVIRKAINIVRQEITQGVTLSRALAEQQLFPPIAVQMVRAGEESGQLAHMLGRLADYYEEEVEHRIQQLTTMLEPLLILLIGGMVGVLAVALYQPIFQLGHHL